MNSALKKKKINIDKFIIKKHEQDCSNDEFKFNGGCAPEKDKANVITILFSVL